MKATRSARLERDTANSASISPPIVCHCRRTVIVKRLSVRKRSARITASENTSMPHKYALSNRGKAIMPKTERTKLELEGGERTDDRRETLARQTPVEPEPWKPNGLIARRHGEQAGNESRQEATLFHGSPSMKSRKGIKFRLLQSNRSAADDRISRRAWKLHLKQTKKATKKQQNLRRKKKLSITILDSFRFVKQNESTYTVIMFEIGRICSESVICSYSFRIDFLFDFCCCCCCVAPFPLVDVLDPSKCRRFSGVYCFGLATNFGKVHKTLFA